MTEKPNYATRRMDELLAAPRGKTEADLDYDYLLVAYAPDEDRYYLVGKDEALALPMPPIIHAHIAELLARPEDRLGCHAGFVEWPLKDGKVSA